MTTTVSFRCRNCQAQLRASVQLIGRWKSCPGCQARLVVPARPLPDSGPVLVFDDRSWSSLPPMR
jgi:DNA-directed RNA polymerase subunit RPC12/RpoP